MRQTWGFVRAFAILAILGGIALLSVAPLSASKIAPERGAIHGTLFHSDGSVAVNIPVSLEMSSDRGIVSARFLATVTDAAGTFRFDRLAPGEYQVQSTLTGKKSGKKISVSLNGTSTVEIHFPDQQSE